MAKRKINRASSGEEEEGSAHSDCVTSLVSSITKDLGEGSAQIMSNMIDNAYMSQVKSWVTTGFIELDRVISKGKGLPCGKICEIYGDEATGKTALSQFFIKQFQNSGGIAVYLDFETALDEEHLKGYGIDTGNLVYASVDTIEQGFDVIMSTLKTMSAIQKKTEKDIPVIIVWDSVAMAIARAEEEEKSHEDAHVAEQARAMSKGMRKIRKKISNTNCFALFTNQTRDKIGVRFGDKKTTPGGNALKFAASIRLQTFRLKTLTREVTRKGKKIKIRKGYVIGVNVKKTRFAPPHQEAQFILSFDVGPDPDASLMNYLKRIGVLKSAGRNTTISELGLSFLTKEWKKVYRSNKAGIHKLIASTEKTMYADDE